MKVLFLTHRLPYAPNRGDRIRSYHMLRFLMERAEVDLFSLIDADDAAEVEGMKRWLPSVTTARRSTPYAALRSALALANRRPLTHALLDAPDAARQLDHLVNVRKPDVVLAFCSGMARFCLAGGLKNLPFVLDMVDVDSRKWKELGATTNGPRGLIYRRESRLLSQFEAVAARMARCSLVVNDRERSTLTELAPEARISVIENGVDLDYFRATQPQRDAGTVVFCGVMDYQPNVEGVIWFVTKVWPLVRNTVPDARFTIVGARPSTSVAGLAAMPGVTVTGSVPDVRPYLWSSRVSVAPLLTARGLQNKVLEALAAGLPAVVTGAVAEGLPVSVRGVCDVSDDAAVFAAQVVTRLAAESGDRDFSVPLRPLTWQAKLDPVIDILRSAATAEN